MTKRSLFRLASLLAATGALAPACSRATPVATDSGPPAVVVDAAIVNEPDAFDASSADAMSGPCPVDMAHVDTMFCPEIERECLDLEHEEPNHLKICHHFKEGSNQCKTKEERRQFCIDRYEYPNQAGAHPVWNATWYQAQATCQSKGKRLCWASEWTAACEGPEHTPFPYGWERDHDTCNMDNFFIDPRKGDGGFLFSSHDKAVQHKELSRLDQSLPSGALKDCKSGFGVYDQPGNWDEWVVSDQKPQHKSKWAGLKGGAWGHVRNACRPMSFSHTPEEWYYFWSFRCCKDAEGAPIWEPPLGNMPAPKVEAKDEFPDPIVPTNPPGPSKTKFGRTDHGKNRKK